MSTEIYDESDYLPREYEFLRTTMQVPQVNPDNVKEFGDSLASLLRDRAPTRSFYQRALQPFALDRGTGIGYVRSSGDVVPVPGHEKRIRISIPRNNRYSTHLDRLFEAFIDLEEAHYVTNDRSWYRACLKVAQEARLHQHDHLSGNLRRLASIFGDVRMESLSVYLSSGLRNPLSPQLEYAASDEDRTLIGHCCDVTFRSDGFRHPEHKVFPEGSFLMVRQPLTHGVYSDRDGIQCIDAKVTDETIDLVFTENHSSAVLPDSVVIVKF